MKISISKALLELSRAKGEYKKVIERVKACTSVLYENGFPDMLNEVLSEAAELRDKIVSVKDTIMKANIASDNFKLIARLAELKGFLSVVSELDTTDGMKETNGFSREKNRYKSQLSNSERRKVNDVVQKEINSIIDKLNSIIDKLNDFNASTQIEI